MCKMDNVVVLQDEDGNDVEFEFLDLVKLDGAEYVVLTPLGSDSDNGSEVIVLEVGDTDEDEMECYTVIGDEGTLMRVFDIFKDRFKDVYEFVE